jgi:hypothetical protein
MRRSPNHLKSDQMDLFHLPGSALDYRALPAEVKQRTVQLLARLLREHQVRRTSTVCGREVRDE